MADEQLEALRHRGRGILSDALTRPVEGTHGGNEAARQQAIGKTFSSILESWDRLMREVEAAIRAERAKPVATTAAVIPMQGRGNR